MNRRLFCLELFGSGLAIGSLTSAAVAAPPFSSTSQATGNAVKLQWHKSLKAAHKLAIQTDKPMLIVFGASWCAYCHKLERETLTDNRLVTAIEKDFIPVHQDFDTDSKVAKILEVERLPCTVALSPQADLLMKSEGFKDFKGFIKILQGALEKQTEIRQAQHQVSTR